MAGKFLANPRLAMMRSRSLAARTDAIFLQIDMAKENGTADEIRFDCGISIDFGLDGGRRMHWLRRKLVASIRAKMD